MSFSNYWKLLFLIMMCMAAKIMYGQHLSKLHHNSKMPVYSTYAAPMERSSYRIDHAYEMMWYDQETGIEFRSRDGGSLGLAFRKDDDLRYKLKRYHSKPLILASYNDIVKFVFRPFENIHIEGIFNVYSSEAAIVELLITNQSSFGMEMEILPFIRFNKPFEDYDFSGSSVNFKYSREKDGWMKSHNIPYIEKLEGSFVMNFEPDSVYGISELPVYFADGKKETDKSPAAAMLTKEIVLAPGSSTKIRILKTAGIRDADNFRYSPNRLMKIDLEEIITENERIYSQIPHSEYARAHYPDLYHNAFTLIRQCMMPPEGESSYNYYIFSREPKWGWGYGGQVFHESLVMLAYAHFDPESAMNSQRVYFERQSPEGYINYRTGPYLNEDILRDGQFTSSAPWFNYINYEIFKVTGDTSFLTEAYTSGTKFFEYFTTNRDSDNDGLCEWGAHAVLESVRDARVAVWDKVGWPSHFEGPDINSMLVMEAKALSKMASALGKPEESKSWQEDADNRTVLINQYMWDEDSGFYYNIDKTDHDFSYENPGDLKRKEIIGFLPLWAGVADKDKAKKLVQHLTNPRNFGRKYGIPTLSADDPYYNPIGYWNGPVWVQWQYLVFRGLIDYGYYSEAEHLALKVADQINYHLINDHTFWEFYSPDERHAGWNKTYIWTGIIARFFIDLDGLE